MYWFFYLSTSLSIYLCISIIKYSVFMFMKKQKNTHKNGGLWKAHTQAGPLLTSCSWSHKSCNSETSPAGSSTGGTSTEGTATACTARPAWPAWPVVVSTGGFTAVGFLGFLGEASKGKLFFGWELATSQREAFVVFYPVLFSYSICFFSGPNQTSKKKHAARLLRKLIRTI